MHLNLLLLHEFKLSSQHGDEFSLVSQFIFHLIYKVYSISLRLNISANDIYSPIRSCRVRDEEKMPSTIFKIIAEEHFSLYSILMTI